MYDQQYYDELYLQSNAQYLRGLEIERIKNYFSIVASIFTILWVLYMLVKNK